MTAIYLASRSPRRRELLLQMRVPHEVLELAATDVDEPRLPGESPADYVVRTAREKAERGVTSVRERGLSPRPVLSADTTVILGDEILGKPVDRDDAARMLRRLSGTRHEVRTALALAVDDVVHEAVSITQVQFRELSERDIERYCDSGEPYDKAGGYGIQGLAGMFVERIEGSYTGVMGLPLFETARLLAHAGILLP
nr:septum formation inhibitor Maf [Pseudomonas sp.]